MPLKPRGRNLEKKTLCFDQSGVRDKTAVDIFGKGVLSNLEVVKLLFKFIREHGVKYGSDH